MHPLLAFSIAPNSSLSNSATEALSLSPSIGSAGLAGRWSINAVKLTEVEN